MPTETPNETTPRATRAWQDGTRALFEGYTDTWRRWSELGSTLWQSRGSERTVAMGEMIQKIAVQTREVATAQAAIAGEWLRAPMWLTGAASPADLQARYAHLFEAQRALVGSYLDAAMNWQRTLTGMTERVTETAREVTNDTAATARRVANDAREVQQATVDATRQTAATAADTASRAVREAQETVKETTERIELAQRPVKGNVSAGGEKIYHLPGQSSYERTDPDETFATEEEARNAGYRRALTPGGGSIKGNISRSGERIYHLPGQANYDRVEADLLFEDEAQATAAGFRPAQR